MSNYITITATSIQNAAGTPLASGTLSFQAVDNTGSPIAFRVGGNGQVITSPVITPISAGAIGSFQVADPSQAAPSGFYYRVVISDASGQTVAKYTDVVVSGPTWALDSYIPTTTTIPPAGGTVNGPVAFTGEVTVQTPVIASDAATKGYVDTGLATKVPTTTTVNGHLLSGNVTVSASDLTTGTLPHAQLPALVSSDIPANAANTSGNAATATNVAYSGLTGTVPTWNQNTSGTAAGLSANITESQVTSLVTDLGNRALTSTTVNGHALSANVTVSASDLTTGTLPHAQLPTLVSGDIPNNAANTSGSAATATNALSLGGNLANTYAPLASPTFTGTVTAPTVNVTSAIQIGGSVGSSGQVLRSNGTTTSWATPSGSGGSILYSYAGTTDTVAAPANTTTSFATSYTIPASTIVATTLLRVTFTFSMTVSASAPAESFRLTLGGVQVYSAFAVSPTTTMTGGTGGISFLIHGTAAAGSSVAVITSPLVAPGAATGNITPFNYSVVAPSQLVATNGTLVIQPQFFSNAATAGNSLTLNQMLVEVLVP